VAGPASGAWRVPAVCAAVAAACGLATAAAAADGHGATALVHMTSGESMTQLVPSGFWLDGPFAHYDGVYFYAIARDPLARGQAHHLLDLASYRYGHPGYGWLAWIGSGGGMPRAVPYALLVVSLLGLAIAGAAASMLARDVGLSPWWGLSVALNPGLLFAVSVDTSETVGLALALVAIVAWSRGRWLWAGVAIAAGCFTKEPLLLVPLGLLAWELVRFARGTRPSQIGRRVAALVTGPVLYAAWIAYCWWVFLVLPSSQINQLAWPLAGWVDTFHRAADMTQSGDAQVGMATSALLVATGGLLALGLVRATRLVSPVDPVFAALAILAFCTNWLVLLYPKDLVRTMALPLALLPFVVGAAVAGTHRGSADEPGRAPANA
jgi:hypothetical protein